MAKKWADMDSAEKKQGLVGLVLLVVIGLVAFTMCSGSDDESGPRGNGITAEVMCEEFVKERLKAPSTAKFSDQQHRASGDDWVVAGVVDSQNAFGATIRGSYTCTLRNTDGDEWQASTVLVE